MQLTPEQFATLRLIRTPGVGPVGFFSLKKRFGSAAAALENLHTLRKKLTPPAHSVLTAEMAALEQLQAAYVFFDDAAYPAALRHIPDPPPVITVKGNLHLLSRGQIAIVGNRNASGVGLQFTRKLARAFGEAGWVVTSGLARGVDTAAHNGALEAPAGTIAVLGGGLDHIYPPENAPLYHNIAENGLLVAENPPGTALSATLFPRRNRLIAGMCQALVVTEAARRSGSLITARLAGDYGRDVFAVPGHPTDPRSEGPNHLLREGAALLQTAQDVLDNLSTHPFPSDAQGDLFSRKRKTFMGTETAPAPTANTPLPDPAPATDDIGRIKALLGPTPVQVDRLVEQTGLSAGAVSAALTELELDGAVTILPGGQVGLSSN